MARPPAYALRSRASASGRTSGATRRRGVPESTGRRNRGSGHLSVGFHAPRSVAVVALVVMPFVVLVVEVVRVHKNAPAEHRLEDEQHRQCCNDSPHKRHGPSPARAVPRSTRLLSRVPAPALRQQLRLIIPRAPNRDRAAVRSHRSASISDRNSWPAGFMRSATAPARFVRANRVPPLRRGAPVRFRDRPSPDISQGKQKPGAICA